MAYTTSPRGSTALAALDGLQGVRLVLASKSPRRREIWELMGLQNFEVVVSDFDEDLPKSDFVGPNRAKEYCEATARQKTLAVSRLLSSGSDHGDQRPTIIVGSDTVVDVDGDILEKPGSIEDATRMMERLSGRSHMVHSAVALEVLPGDSQSFTESFAESTTVTFGALTAEDIAAYVRTSEPYDKAGGYGIQGIGGQFVDRIDGCYFNVMGFPMRRFSVRLAGILARVQP